jgi:hypothetical protein
MSGYQQWGDWYASGRSMPIEKLLVPLTGCENAIFEPIMGSLKPENLKQNQVGSVNQSGLL